MQKRIQRVPSIYPPLAILAAFVVVAGLGWVASWFLARNIWLAGIPLAVLTGILVIAVTMASAFYLIVTVRRIASRSE